MQAAIVFNSCGVSQRRLCFRHVIPWRTTQFELTQVDHLQPLASAMIRRLKSGSYRLYSRKTDPKTGKRRNLGTFRSRAAAEKHERAVQYFKRR